MEKLTDFAAVDPTVFGEEWRFVQHEGWLPFSVTGDSLALIAPSPGHQNRVWLRLEMRQPVDGVRSICTLYDFDWTGSRYRRLGQELFAAANLECSLGSPPDNETGWAPIPTQGNLHRLASFLSAAKDEGSLAR